MLALIRPAVSNFRPTFAANHHRRYLSTTPFFSSAAAAGGGGDLYVKSNYLNRILQLLRTCQNMTHLFQIQAQLITSSLFQNPSFGGRILKISAHYGDLHYTLLLFRYITLPDTFCVNIVIKAFALSSVPNQAVVFYFEMLKNGFFPNSYTFPSLFSSCSMMGCSEVGLKCHGQAIKYGVDSLLPVKNSLIHMYASYGFIDIAKKMFVKMCVRDVVSWNSMVYAYVKIGNLSVAHQVFNSMPHKNVISWNILITGYLRGGNPGFGLKLFRQMVRMGFRGNDTTMVSVVTACGRSARLKEGQSVHGSLIRTFTRMSLIINTTLIYMYSRCQRTDIAQKLFDRLLVRNLVCWNVMILGHCLSGNPEDGLNLFSQMHSRTRLIDRDIDLDDTIELDEGVLPNEITYVGVLCACARKGLLTEGRNYFNQMTDVFGINRTFAHYWCLANIFSSVGLMQEAVETLRNFPQLAESPPESSRLALVLGLCRFNGDMVLGEQIAKALIYQDPLNESFHAFLMTVYAVADRWEDVARTKDIMKAKGFKRMPGSTLVDLKEIVHNLEVVDELQNVYIQDANMVIDRNS